MQAGDFTRLAKDYAHRPGYSRTALRVIGQHAGVFADQGVLVADVGAGTGKLTSELVQMGLRCTAVEPNDEMRAEGIKALSEHGVTWIKGSAESTGLPSAVATWLLMGSSFHWTDVPVALAEFHRVLKPGGCFTAVWNPRDLERSSFHRDLEAQIYAMVPGIQRRSSGTSKFTENLDATLVSTGHFEDCFLVETRYELSFTRERFLGAWRSVNDIQAQAGPARWAEILQTIERACGDRPEISVPYRTRAWTVRRK